MAKIGALGAYIYQAGLAFGLLILVSHLLPAGDFAAFSLFVSIVQFGAIACFEWVRFACSRFYPGPDAKSEAHERGAIAFEFLCSSGVCALAGVIAVAAGTPIWLAAAGVVATILQGGGELHLTMLRFRQAFRPFSLLQGARATIYAAMTLAAAAYGADFGHVVAGIVLAGIIYSAVALLLSRREMGWRLERSGGTMRRHLAYGGVSAGASIAGMLAPLCLKAVLTNALGASAAAGAMLALDLIQRLFILVVSSLQAIRYPDLVSIFDREGASASLRIELGRYYGLLACSSLVAAAGLMAVLGLGTRLLIAPDLQAGFLQTAPALTLMAVLRGWVQALFPTPAHLQRRLFAIATLAVVECALICACAYAAALLMPGSASAIANGALAGAALAALAGVALLGLLPFALPWKPVAMAAAALLASSAASFLLADTPFLSAATATACFVALGAWPSLAAMRWAIR